LVGSFFPRMGRDGLNGRSDEVACHDGHCACRVVDRRLRLGAPLHRHGLAVRVRIACTSVSVAPECSASRDAAVRGRAIALVAQVAVVARTSRDIPDVRPPLRAVVVGAAHRPHSQAAVGRRTRAESRRPCEPCTRRCNTGPKEQKVRLAISLPSPPMFLPMVFV